MTRPGSSQSWRSRIGATPTGHDKTRPGELRANRRAAVTLAYGPGYSYQEPAHAAGRGDPLALHRAQPLRRPGVGHRGVHEAKGCVAFIAELGFAAMAHHGRSATAGAPD